MEQTTPRLAEALREERAWEADGVTVLTASVTLPQLAGRDRRAKRFNRYYRRFCRAYTAYCARFLLPEAVESCRAAMAVSAPWHAARAELRCSVSLCAGEVLSIVSDARETVCGLPPFTLRRSEVWDLGAGLPMPLEEFFPPRAPCRRTLLRFARAETPARIERGAVYRENWRALLRRALNTRDFYLTEGGLCFFYPPGAVAPAREGVVSYTLPWDAEHGPFLPPEA